MLIAVSVTAAFPTALTPACTFVLGMVAVLLLMSMGCERLGTRAARPLRGRRVPLFTGASRRGSVGGSRSGLLLLGVDYHHPPRCRPAGPRHPRCDNVTDLMLAPATTGLSVPAMWIVCPHPVHSNSADPGRGRLAALRREVTELRHRAETR